MALAVFAFGFGTALRSNAGTDMVEPYRAPAPSYNYAPPPPPRPVFYRSASSRSASSSARAMAIMGRGMDFTAHVDSTADHAYWRGHHRHWH